MLPPALCPQPSSRYLGDSCPWPIAKRHAAELLMFPMPWKWLLLSDYPKELLLWVPLSGASLPLKCQGDAGTMVDPASMPHN